MLDEELKALVSYEKHAVERVSPMADDAKKQDRRVEPYMMSLMRSMSGALGRPTSSSHPDRAAPPQRTITVTFKSVDSVHVYGVASRSASVRAD